ncbi:hypothetical protein K8I61_03645 [bacterium]|nr:hypothetical protein [bacterium]
MRRSFTSIVARLAKTHRVLFAFSVALAAMPGLVIIEDFLLGKRHTLYVLDTLMVIPPMISGMFFGAVFNNIPSIGPIDAAVARIVIMAALLLFVVVATFLPRMVAAGFFRAVDNVLVLTFSTLGLGLWFLACAWFAWAALVFGLAWFAGMATIVHHRVARRAFVVPLVVFGLFSPIADRALLRAAAVDANPQKISGIACYDFVVTRSGETLVLRRDSRHPVYFDGRSWTKRGDMTPAENAELGSDGQTIYIANSASENDEPRLTIFRYGEATDHVPEPGCQTPMTLTVDEPGRRIFMTCEGGQLVTYNLADDTWRMIGLPWLVYGVGHAPGDDRVYYSTLILGGYVGVVSAERQIVLAQQYVGLLTQDIAVDEITGLVWLALPASRDMAVFDRDLRIVDRVRVGGGARKLAIDREHRLLFVGHYHAGIVTVLDLDTREVVERAKIGLPGQYFRSNGIAIGPGGWIELADLTGAWRLDFKPLLERLEKSTTAPPP